MSGHAGRPANDPAKRIGGLAVLLARHHRLFVREPDMGSFLAPSARELVASFTVAPLIGRSRAIELLTNAALPWALAVTQREHRPEVEALAVGRFAQLPRPAPYGALAFLERNLRAGDTQAALTARRQQGLLALYKSECTQGGCGRCALS
jgi:hypothetical protein